MNNEDRRGFLDTVGLVRYMGFRLESCIGEANTLGGCTQLGYLKSVWRVSYSGTPLVLIIYHNFEVIDDNWRIWVYTTEAYYKRGMGPFMSIGDVVPLVVEYDWRCML